MPSAAAPGGTITVALITLDNGRDHTRPNTLGPLGLASLDAAISTAIEAAPDAIAVTGKPFIFAVGADLSQPGMVADRESAAEAVRGFRPPGVPPARHLRHPDVRLRQRRGLRWRYGTRAALRLPDPGGERGRDGPARGLPRHPARLGWHPAAPADRRPGERRHRHHRERAEPEPDAQAQGRPAARAWSMSCWMPRTTSSSRWPGWPACWTARSPCSATSSPAPPTSEWAAALERGKIIADMRTHGASPAPYRALEMIALSRTTDLADGPGRRTGGAGRPDHDAGVPGRGLLLQPGAEACPPAGRRPRPQAGPQGHQGRRHRRRSDGRSAGPAVRPATCTCRW